jgi:hypothetical protein
MENLTWGAHVRSLRIKLCKAVYMMKILKETMCPYMIRNIYYSNFHLCLRYGIILWGEDSECNNLSKLQKKALRIISGVSHVDKYLKTNILTLLYTYYK